MIDPRGGDFYLATSGDRNLTIDTRGGDHGKWLLWSGGEYLAGATWCRVRPGDQARTLAALLPFRRGPSAVMMA